MLSGGICLILLYWWGEYRNIYCDVVGHGISASMMTMFVRQTMRSIKDDILSPSACLTELHKRFVALGLEADKYFTIFFMVYIILGTII